MKKDLEAIEIENLHFIIKMMYELHRNQFTFGVNAKERNKYSLELDEHVTLSV